MASFSELLPACYYLIQENEHGRLELVYVLMVTEKAVLVEYQDEEQTMAWFKKTDSIFEITEQLTEEQAIIFESIFDDGEEEEPIDWDDFDSEIDPWFGDDDDSDNDDKIKALNN